MDPEQITQLCQFVGYGILDAPLVFLGIEEKGRNPALYPGDIDARVEHYTAPVMDMRVAHDSLYQYTNPPAPSPYHALPGMRPVQQWTTATCFALELLSPLDPAIQAMTIDTYWREQLGRADGHTLLAECNPVPRPKLSVAVSGYNANDVWVQQRLPILSAFFDQHVPLFVVAYGVPAHNMVAPLFGEPAGNGWIHVNALVNGQVQAAGDVCLTEQGVVVCRTGFFGQGHFNRQSIPFLAAQMRALLPHG